MNKDSVRRTRLVFGILVSLAAIAAGVCFITACLGIYLSGGDQIYTPEKVAAAFRPIAVPVYICLGLILVSILLQLVLWQVPGKAPKTKQIAMQLRRLQLTRDPAAADDSRRAAIGKIRKGRNALYIVCAIVFPDKSEVA